MMIWGGGRSHHISMIHRVGYHDDMGGGGHIIAP